MVTTLDDARIQSIVQNTNLHVEFPQIASISQKIYKLPERVAQSTCKCNASKKLRATNSVNFAVAEMKNYIKRMTQAERNKFKKAIGSEEIQFTQKDASGVLREYRF